MADTAVVLEDKYSQAPGGMEPEARYNYDLHIEYSSSSYRQTQLDLINEGRRAYAGDVVALKDPPWDGSSNKSMGLANIAVDNLEPRIYNKLVAEDNFIQVDPVGADDVDKVEPTKEFMNWAVVNNMKLPKKMKPICHDLLEDGTVYLVYPWKEKEVLARVRAPQAKFKDIETGKDVDIPPSMLQGGNPDELLYYLFQNNIVPDGEKDGYDEIPRTDFTVDLKGLKLEDTFWPDHNDDWDSQPFQRFIYPTLGKLKELEKKGMYKNISEKLVTGYRRDTTEQEEDNEVQYSEYEQECKLVECYYMWKGEWKIGTYGWEDNWIEVRNEKLKDIYWFDHKPIKRFRIYPKSKEQLGTSVPNKIKYFHEGIDELYNAMINNAKVEVTPFAFVNEAATGIGSNKKVEMKPGKMNAIPKDANVTFPNIGVKSPVYESFINLLMTFFERTLSLMDYSAGTRSKTVGAGGDTASGMAMILQEGNIKHNYTGESLQDTFGDLLTDIASLYAQNIPQGAKMRLKQDGLWVFQPIDVNSLQGQFNIRIDVSDASSNTMTNRNDSLTLYQTLIQNPLVNQEQTTEDLLTSFNKKDLAKYITPELSAISAAIAQVPELAGQIQQVIQQHMQQKQEEERNQELRGQAEDNVKRQEIQNEVDEPLENKRIVESENKKFKGKQVGKVIDMIGGLPEDAPPREI